MASVTMTNLKQFKKQYDAARDAGDVSFVFEGQPVLVAYAKYLIEFMESAK